MINLMKPNRFNLYFDSSCASALITGKIVRRQFTGNGLALTGVVIEASDGSRDFVNTSVEPGWCEYGNKGLGSKRTCGSPISRRQVKNREMASNPSTRPARR